MFTRAIADGFTSIVGAGSVLTKLEDIIPYSFDGTAALRQVPSAVVFPHTSEDVSRCVKFALAPCPDRHTWIGNGAERRERSHRRQRGLVPRADEQDPRHRSEESRPP